MLLAISRTLQGLYYIGLNQSYNLDLRAQQCHILNVITGLQIQSFFVQDDSFCHILQCICTLFCSG